MKQQKVVWVARLSDGREARVAVIHEPVWTVSPYNLQLRLPNGEGAGRRAAPAENPHILALEWVLSVIKHDPTIHLTSWGAL